MRQGKPLVKNLRRATSGQPLESYYPQKRYLALLGTGDRRAIGIWGSLCVGPSRGLWLAKDWIDRRFIAQFKGGGQKRNPSNKEGFLKE